MLSFIISKNLDDAQKFAEQEWFVVPQSSMKVVLLGTQLV